MSLALESSTRAGAKDAFDTLMDEHRLIEQVLGALDAFTKHLEQGADPFPLREFAEFFRGYADKVHHGKEEDILFASLVARGYSTEAGPVAVMLYDHAQGRALVSALAAAGDAGDCLDAQGREQTVRAARRYASLLRHHIYKEDTILFPMARGGLSPSDLRRLDREFAAFEQAKVSASLRQLGLSLIEDFPPTPPETDASDPIGDGCDLHCTLAGCPVRNPWDEPIFPES
ncbi:MAG: hemerythrin domain-containing protein [Deltaproteobacteria bacterium]|nr:hemerythrin domain-containing protein [Deltaproteobacteria bacterium]